MYTSSFSLRTFFRHRLRPLARAVLTVLTAAWLMLALQPCAMAGPCAMSMPQDCAQCPMPDTGVTAQADGITMASCASMDDRQLVNPAAVTPVTPALPILLSWIAPPYPPAVVVFTPPDYVAPSPLLRFGSLRI